MTGNSNTPSKALYYYYKFRVKRVGGVGAPLERNLSWRAGKTHALLQTGNFSSHAVFLLLTVTDILIFPLQQRTKQHLQTCSLVPIITNFNSSQIYLTCHWDHLNQSPLLSSHLSFFPYFSSFFPLSLFFPITLTLISSPC